MYTPSQEYQFTGSLYFSGLKKFKKIRLEKIDIVNSDINWKVKLPNDIELLCDSSIIYFEDLLVDNPTTIYYTSDKFIQNFKIEYKYI